MKLLVKVLHLAIVLAVLSGLALAQKPTVPQKSPVTLTAKDARLFALEDLRPGMKGTARTVFSGTEPEEFGVEILGVLPGFPRTAPVCNYCPAERRERGKDRCLWRHVWFAGLHR